MSPSPVPSSSTAALAGPVQPHAQVPSAPHSNAPGSQQPTLINTHIRSVSDAQKLFYAVQTGLLPKIERRLDAVERKRLRPGDVYVWEEKGAGATYGTPVSGSGVLGGPTTSTVDKETYEVGIERWTEGLSWSASRIRDDFLIYFENVKKKEKGVDRDGLKARSLENQILRDGERDLYIKQTYSVLRNDIAEDGSTIPFPLPDGSEPSTSNSTQAGSSNFSTSASDGKKDKRKPRKWHLNAYFTKSTEGNLATIDTIPFLRDLTVPEGLFTSARQSKKPATTGASSTKDDTEGQSALKKGRNREGGGVQRTYAPFPSGDRRAQPRPSLGVGAGGRDVPPPPPPSDFRPGPPASSMRGMPPPPARLAMERALLRRHPPMSLPPPPSPLQPPPLIAAAPPPTNAMPPLDEFVSMGEYEHHQRLLEEQQRIHMQQLHGHGFPAQGLGEQGQFSRFGDGSLDLLPMDVEEDETKVHLPQGLRSMSLGAYSGSQDHSPRIGEGGSPPHAHSVSPHIHGTNSHLAHPLSPQLTSPHTMFAPPPMGDFKYTAQQYAELHSPTFEEQHQFDGSQFGSPAHAHVMAAQTYRGSSVYSVGSSASGSGSGSSGSDPRSRGGSVVSWFAPSAPSFSASYEVEMGEPVVKGEFEEFSFVPNMEQAMKPTSSSLHGALPGLAGTVPTVGEEEEEEEEDLAVYQPMPPQPEGGEVQSAVPGGDSIPITLTLPPAPSPLPPHIQPEPPAPHPTVITIPSAPVAPVIQPISRSPTTPTRLAPLHTLRRTHPYKRSPVDDRALRMLGPGPASGEALRAGNGAGAVPGM